MKYRFNAPDKSDKRIEYAAKELCKMGYEENENADFILLGVNPKINEEFSIPCFAGNVSGKNIIDYTKDEAFAIKNAYLTAEAAISLAVQNSENSLINSSVLITGFGRIGKALARYLQPFTSKITVCARSEEATALAASLSFSAKGFEDLSDCSKYDFIFNTVPHPIFNKQELISIKDEALLIDLASFPGGVDVHFSEHYSVNLIIARGLPAKYSPKAAGIIVAQTVNRLSKEVIV